MKISPSVEHEPGFHGDRFAVLVNETRFFRCNAKTPVAAVVLLGCKEQWPIEDADEEPFQEHHLGPILLTNIQSVNSGALEAVAKAAPQLQWLDSIAAGQVYLGNACIECGILQGDWFLRKPNGPFFPMTDEAADTLVVQWIEVPIQVAAGYSVSSWIDGIFARRGELDLPPRKRKGRSKQPKDRACGRGESLKTRDR